MDLDNKYKYINKNGQIKYYKIDTYLDKYEAAKDINCPGEVLKLISKNADESLLCAILENPNCPESLLNHYSLNSNDSLIISILKNINCRERILNRFLNDLYVLNKKKCYALLNPNCPEYILNSLSSFCHTGLDELLKNPKCPPELLDEFCLSYQEEVSKNPNTPDYLLRKLDKDGFASFVRPFIAANPNCPRDLIDKYARHLNDSFFRSLYYEILDGLAQNPKCPPEILEQLIDEYRDKVAKNPNTQEHVLRKIFNKSRTEKRYLVVLNPNCPFDILESCIDCDDNLVLADIAKNPNCTYELLEKLANKKSYIVNKHILRNPLCDEKLIKIIVKHAKSEDNIKDALCLPSCPNYLRLNYFESYDSWVNLLARKNTPLEYLFLYDKLKGFNFEKIDNVFYYVFFFYYIKDFYKNNNQYYSDLKNKINSMILDDQFDAELYGFITLIDNWQMCFPNEVYFKLIKYKGYSSRKLETFIEHNFKKKRNKNQNDIKSFIKKPIINDNAVLFECENINALFDICNAKKFEYGEYPYKTVNFFDSLMLDLMLINHSLEKTYRTYTKKDRFRKIKLDEYILNNRRFVKDGDTWLEVKPLIWYFDFLNNVIETKNHLLGKISAADFYEDAILNSRYIKKIDEVSKHCEMVKLKDALENRKRKLEEIEHKKKILKEKSIELLRETKELYDEELIIANKSKIPRITIFLDLLIKKVDNHFEIDSAFIPFLKFIDLSVVSDKNLKVSGIDFRDTNISLDPQNVYNKDLSYSFFDDDTFVLKRFDECNMKGTDISKETDSFGYENAKTDNSTKLPNDSITLGRKI